MKQIEDTILGKEINQIISNPNSKYNYVKHSCILHTFKLDINIDLVESIEIMRDYNNNIADYTLATFYMQMGDYVKDIYPFRDNLELTIVRNVYGIKYKERYKFVISNNQLGMIGSRYNSSSRDELNKLEQARIIGQCINREVEALRLQYTSGVYEFTTVKDVMYSAMQTTINKLKIGGVKINPNINISNVHNTRNYQHVKIPTGVNILDLPSYIQDTTYGVYNGGIGTYLQRYSCVACTNLDLFIYPLYNNQVFDNVEKKLVIYGVNSVKFEMVEHTYLVDGDVVKIISGGSTRSMDSGENDMMNNGNGYTYTDPNLILERNSIVTDNGVVVDSDKTNDGGFNKMRLDGSLLSKHLGPTDNAYKHRSDVLKSTMMVFQIQWNHCNIDLIYPGMPVMYTYMDIEYGLVKLKGAVQSLYAMYNEGTKTVNALMNIMVEKPYIDPTTTLKKNDVYNTKAGVN